MQRIVAIQLAICAAQLPPELMGTREQKPFTYFILPAYSGKWQHGILTTALKIPNEAVQMKIAMKAVQLGFEEAVEALSDDDSPLLSDDFGLGMVLY